MQFGMIGLGRMGANMVQRLLAAGHACCVNDISADAVEALKAKGATGSAKLSDFIAMLQPPRAIWLMLPAGIVDKVMAGLLPLLSPGDTVIDGANSHFVAQLDPVFRILAPGIGTVGRTGGETAAPTSAEQGYLHCGPAGAGHFVKMVHNGIEYGMMAAFAEGFNVLKHAGAGRADHKADAETAPLRNPEFYQYNFDVAAIAEVWRRGSVVASWLLDLTAEALKGNGDLTNFAGRVSDSGEGRWTLEAAIDEGVPTPVIAASLFSRFDSQGKADFANRVQSAMRMAFGGHIEKKA